MCPFDGTVCVTAAAYDASSAALEEADCML